MNLIIEHFFLLNTLIFVSSRNITMDNCKPVKEVKKDLHCSYKGSNRGCCSPTLAVVSSRAIYLLSLHPNPHRRRYGRSQKLPATPWFEIRAHPVAVAVALRKFSVRDPEINLARLCHDTRRTAVRNFSGFFAASYSVRERESC